MAATWRAAALEQAELVSDRLRRLASSGLLFLHDELGLDLGLQPDLWPSWAVLAAVLLGLLVAVWWVVACGGATRRKRRTGSRAGNVTVSVGVSATDGGPSQSRSPSQSQSQPAKTKPEEPKKKSKKKAAEKQKTQPNGRTVTEPQEEVKVAQEIPKQATLPPSPPQKQPQQKQRQQQQQQQQQQPPQPPAQQSPTPADNKADKAKKNKKKPKPEAKQGQNVSTSDGKEPDEGAWETKVSNREKRQQRKKEKGPGDPGSPMAGDRGSKQTTQPVVAAPVSTKKNKESTNLKAEKREAVIAPAPQANWTGSVNSGGWNEMLKIPPQVSTSDGEKWSVNMKKSGHRNSEPLARGQESEGSWTGMDGRFKTERNTVNFSMLGLKPSAGDPVLQSAADLGTWENPTTDDSEWSGYNGLGAADSNWSAPAEPWGNYEDAKAETPAVQELPNSQPQVNQLQDSDDDDKKKGDPSGSGKSKRKRKKKKPEDEKAASQVNSEVVPAPAESSTIKPRPHVPQEELAKQNVIPPASQKKNDQNLEPPKQVQKKKARRET